MMIARYTQAALVAQNRRLAAALGAVRERVPGFGPGHVLAPELEAAA